jgi:hypothetical protein
MTAAVALVARPFRLGERLAGQAAEAGVLHARALAVANLLLAVVGVAVGLVLWAGQRFAPPPVSFVTSPLPIAVHFAMSVAFSLVGAVVAIRQPRNAIGWLFIAIGVLSSYIPAIDFLVAGVGGQFTAPAPMTVLLAWLASNFHLPMTGAIVIVAFLIFPNGHPLPGRWSWAAWLAIGGSLLVGFGQALDPSGLRWYPTMPNPTAVPPADAPVAMAVQLFGLALVMLALGVATWAMVVRYRHYSPESRRGLAGIGVAVLTLAGAGGALFVVRYGIVVPSSAGEAILVTTLVTATLVPILAAFGMLRYHLFDVDLVLTHALVYIPLTGFLAGLYAAAVALFQRVFMALTGDTSDIAIVLTTLVLAGTFSPLRKTLEGFVDGTSSRPIRKVHRRPPIIPTSTRTRRPSSASSTPASIASSERSRAARPQPASRFSVSASFRRLSSRVLRSRSPAPRGTSGFGSGSRGVRPASRAASRAAARRPIRSEIVAS